MTGYNHYVVNESYVKGEKVLTTVIFWVYPNIFDEEEVNYHLCTGRKEVRIYHKLNAGLYFSFDCDKCHRFRCDANCIDSLIYFVKKLYPESDIFVNKKCFKEHFKNILGGKHA